jgi:hypothetical protein
VVEAGIGAAKVGAGHPDDTGGPRSARGTRPGAHEREACAIVQAMHRADALRGIFRRSLSMSANERSHDEPEDHDEPDIGDVPPALLFQVTY